MLNTDDYLDAFIKIQKHSMDATKVVAAAAQPGVSEQELADLYHSELARSGITEFWYPTLICAEKFSGQPLTRRNHLPSREVRLRDNDLVILDTTPLQKTVWGNWTIVKNIGSDDFYKKLCGDIFGVVTETVAEVLSGNYTSLADIYSHVMAKAADHELESIDPRGNVGHNIFQVPEGQTVDKTPMEQRIFIDATDHPVSTPALISIEPELARVNLADNVRYGGKFQFVIPYGCGDKGLQIINDQCRFYDEMCRSSDNEYMIASLSPLKMLNAPSNRKTIHPHRAP